MGAPASDHRVYGGAPALGESHVPADSPSPSGDVYVYGGAPAISGVPLDKGEKQVGGPSGEIYPEVYGGGARTGFKGKQVKSAKGNGIAGTGTIP